MRPVAALAWPIVPEREAQDSVLLRPPLPQAQPKAESFSSVWLLELSGNIFLGIVYPKLCIRSNCIPPGPQGVRILLWNAGLPGRDRDTEGNPVGAMWRLTLFSRLAGL